MVRNVKDATKGHLWEHHQGTTLHRGPTKATAKKHSNEPTITPHNVWAYTINNTDAAATPFESEPTPSLALLGLLDMMTIASRDQEEAEARLLFQSLLESSSDETETTQRLALSRVKCTRTSNGRTRDAYSGEAQSTDAHCPGCGRQCKKLRARFTISRHWRSLSATCVSDKSTRQVRLSDAAFAYLFGG